jgi:endonuclease G
MMLIDLDIAAQAASRWEARTAQRDQTRTKLDEGGSAAAETPQRLRLRLKRLGAAATQAMAAPATSPATESMLVASSVLVQTVGLERVIGKSDIVDISFLELALAVARFVGRVNMRSSPARTAGFGTGFMVSPRLLLTNHHVLRSKADAVHSEIEFDFQNDRNGRLLPVVSYALEPDKFFLTNPALDYTLVSVRERSVDDRVDLKLYGWSRLIADQGKAMLGEALNIIQHPNGQAKKLVLRKNELIDLPDENFAHYVADTEPGSSGSPVYNDQWEVVALHHSGVPRMKNGKYITRDGSVWNGSNTDDIDWVANEGIRVSSLVRDIKNQTLDTAQRRLLDELLDTVPPHPLEAARLAADASALPVPPPNATSFSSVPPGSSTWTIPLRVTVSVGAAALSVEPQPIEHKAAEKNPPEQQVAPMHSSASASAVVQGSEPRFAEPPAAIREALKELESATTRPYYDEAQDVEVRARYYAGITHTVLPRALYQQLNRLLTQTHKNRLAYQPNTHLYPWVDLHEATPIPVLQSIYSGREFDPRKFIEADFQIEQQRQQVLKTLTREAALSSAALEVQLDFLEASMPFNCEHVVPQSWFDKREPMRGDLHHLFACESGCNSFRSNIPYFDFPDFEEAIRQACGKREVGKFEPLAGKGAVARATLYFLLRYPKEIAGSSKEYTEDRVETLKAWHRQHPVDRYEKHRNATIFQKQGNRNPLIDFPEWVESIDFLQGLDRGDARNVQPYTGLPSSDAGISADGENAPVFEGFALELVEDHSTSDAKRIVADVLGQHWNVRRFGDRTNDYEVWDKPAALSVEKAWQTTYELRALAGVAYAEPLFMVSLTDTRQLASTPGAVAVEEAAIRGLCAEAEPLAESSDLEWSLKQAHVFEAWTQLPAGIPPGDGIVIGHPDTGYRRHPEIVQNLLIELGHDFVDGDSDAEDPLVQGPLLNPGHGTGTASVIVSPRGAPQAGAGSTSMVSGVAPGSKIIPIRTGVSVITLISSFNLANAIEYATDRGAHIVSISMGGIFNWRLRQAVLYAQRRGVIVLAAAGNCVRFVVWPAAYEEVIAVAACNARLEIWRGSARGSKVDVTSPGESVWRAQVKEDGSPIVSRSSGTSFAVATTAGVAALWLARHGRQMLVDKYGIEKIPFLFNQMLRETTEPVPAWDAGQFGAGLLNAQKLVAAPLPEVVAPPAFEMEAHVEVDKGGLGTFAHMFESTLLRVPIAAEAAVGRPADKRLHKRLSELLQVSQADLPQRLRQVGQELAFHLATDRELFDLFEQTLIPNSPTMEAHIATSEATNEVRARLSRRASRALESLLSPTPN